MPVLLLRAYMVLLPRLQAEEALQAVAVLQAAHPEYKPEHRRRLLQGWERQAQQESERVKPTVGQLGMVGIRVVKQR